MWSAHARATELYASDCTAKILGTWLTAPPIESDMKARWTPSTRLPWPHGTITASGARRPHCSQISKPRLDTPA